MSNKMDYMLDKMNQPRLPKYIADLMIEHKVYPSQSKNKCRDCNEPLDDDNIYGQCEHCYFRKLNE